MSNYALTWDSLGKRYYESGISRAVLFPQSLVGKGYAPGVAWNGITSIAENPEGGDANELWANNAKYAVIRSSEKLNGSIEAYNHPSEFNRCLGKGVPILGMTVQGQNKQRFGLCYRTEIGNDETDEYGYILHFIYNAVASASDQDNSTLQDSPDAKSYSWEYETSPVKIKGYKSSSLIYVDSRYTDSNLMEVLEEIVYGVVNEDETVVQPRMPDPSEIISLLYPIYIYKMVDLGYITASIVNEHLIITLADAVDVDEKYRDIYTSYVLPAFDGTIVSSENNVGHLIFTVSDIEHISFEVDEERLVVNFE